MDSSFIGRAFEWSRLARIARCTGAQRMWSASASLIALIGRLLSATQNMLDPIFGDSMFPRNTQRMAWEKWAQLEAGKCGFK